MKDLLVLKAYETLTSTVDLKEEDVPKIRITGIMSRPDIELSTIFFELTFWLQGVMDE